MYMETKALTTHAQSEFDRLNRGMEGCGCAECQALYRSMDLEIYGTRVKRYQDIILITSGAPLKPAEQPLESQTDVSKIPDDVPAVPAARGRGRPRVTGAYLSRTTIWRRQQEAKLKMEALPL